MDRSDVLTLISVTEQQDDYGVWRDTETTREIFCEVQSVTRSEFFDAGRAGLNPEFVFRVFFADYEGETICEYNDQRYTIYRTYLAKNDRLELYAERKGGTNAAPEAENGTEGS